MPGNGDRAQSRANGRAAGSRAPDSVRLAPGSHDSPSDGACVVELASLLAGEEFSDRPYCVDPVIAAFLRGWNDRAPDADRERLRPYAERIIGSRASDDVTRARRQICLDWADGAAGEGARRVARRAMTWIRIATYCGMTGVVRPDEGGGDYTARVAFSRRDYDGAFGLLDAMLATGSPGPGSPIHGGGNGAHPSGVNGSNGARANGAGANGAGAPANGNGQPARTAVDEAQPRSGRSG